jgi:hypothetical protein
MCYSKSLSLKSFLFGIISSIYLYTNNNSSFNENKTIALFFSFVSLMQLVEYFLWSDLKCTGINQTTSKIGILLNHFQPVVLLLISLFYLESNNSSSFNINQNVLILINIIYSIYVIYDYKRFLDEKNFCVKPNKKGHLDWTWKHNFNYTFYHLLIFLNLLNYNNYYNLTMSMILSYVIFFVSLTKFRDNIGEFWCLMVTGIPFLFNLDFRNPMNSSST